MKALKAVFLVLLIVAVAAIAYGAVVIRRGFSTKDEPSALESALARTARNLATPSGAKAAKNPFAPTAENLEAGKEHFADHCATCHANDGGAQTEMGPNFYPKPPDLRLPETQNLTDGEIFYIINNGVRMSGMPGWGGSHDADDTWKLVLFIRHLPQMTAEEKKDMERFNPKSFDDDADHAGEHDHGDDHAQPGEHHHH